MRAILVVVLMVIVFCIAHYLFPLIQVIGESMYPTYIDGEIIVGTKLYRKSKLKKGDVVIYKSPNENRIVIKRISFIQANNDGELLLFCLGDNADHSYDSRNYGFVSSENLVCKVIDQRRNNNDVCSNQERWYS